MKPSTLMGWIISIFLNVLYGIVSEVILLSVLLDPVAFADIFEPSDHFFFGINTGKLMFCINEYLTPYNVAESLFYTLLIMFATICKDLPSSYVKLYKGLYGFNKYIFILYIPWLSSFCVNFWRNMDIFVDHHITKDFTYEGFITLREICFIGSIIIQHTVATLILHKMIRVFIGMGHVQAIKNHYRRRNRDHTMENMHTALALRLR